MSTQPIVIQQKSNSTFGTAMKIIGFICLISCLCSIWSSYRTARAVGNAFENMDVKRKKRNPGPIIRDMKMTGDVNTRIDGEHAIPAEILAKMKEVKELNPDMQFNHPLNIDIYDDCDCMQLRQRIQAKDAASGEINIASIGEEVHPRCVKAEGSVYMDGYKHLAKGKGDDGEPWEDRKVIGEVLMMDKPDGMPNVLKVKIGCEENQKNVEDVGLKFKWWRIPKSI